MICAYCFIAGIFTVILDFEWSKFWDKILSGIGGLCWPVLCAAVLINDWYINRKND